VRNKQDNIPALGIALQAANTNMKNRG